MDEPKIFVTEPLHKKIKFNEYILNIHLNYINFSHSDISQNCYNLHNCIPFSHEPFVTCVKVYGVY